MSSDIVKMLSDGTVELGPPKIVQVRSYESEAPWPFYYLHKVQDDHPKVDMGDHQTGLMGSPTGQQVSILPHLNSKETSLFFPLQVASLFFHFRMQKTQCTSSRLCLLAYQQLQRHSQE